MPVDRTQDRYGGRFSSDADQSGVLEGYRRAVRRQDSKMVRRNIEPYDKYGFEQRLSKLRTMTDAERFSEATDAVVAKYKATKGKGGSSSGGSKGGGGSSSGGSRGGGAKRATKPKAPARPKAPAKPRPAPKPKPKQPQHLPPKQAQRLPPKGAAKPKAPTLPPKPAPKKPPVIKPSGKAPVRV